MKSDVLVPIGKIHLGDLAEIKGDSDLVERLRVLDVGRVDYPGRVTRVSVDAVKRFYLRSVCPVESLTVEGEGSIVVTSRSATLDADSLLQLITAFVGPRLDGIKSRDWEIEAPRLPKSVAVPDGGHEVRFELPANFDGRGDETITMTVLMDGKTRIRQTLPFTVRRWSTVVRSVVTIQRGQPVATNQVALERIETTHQNRTLIHTLDEVLGRAALRTVNSGTDLVDSWFERPYAVKEGDQVRLVVSLGAGTVSVMGVARQDGYRGQRIEVQNMDTGKRMQAEVQGPGEVRVVN